MRENKEKRKNVVESGGKKIPEIDIW